MSNDLIIGEIYKCKSYRHGVFNFLLEDMTSEWLLGTITNGVFKGQLSKDKTAGDGVKVKRYLLEMELYEQN